MSENYEISLKDWKEMVNYLRNPNTEVTVALVGKYTQLHDAYLSVVEALKHGGISCKAKVEITWIDSEELNEKNLESNEELAETVQEALVEDSLADQVSVSFTAQYVQLSMKGALLFDSGSDSLKDQAKAVLDKVGVILERYGSNSTIEIEGHTDNVPIHSARFADNEELSSARALSVFYYLTETTSLDPSDLRHAGMGDRVPVADNSTEEGRSKNRRVEIRIYNPSTTY